MDVGVPSLIKERSPCLSRYSTSTEKLGISKNSGHCCRVGSGDVLIVDRISVSAELLSVSVVVVGDVGVVKWSVTRGMISG